MQRTKTTIKQAITLKLLAVSAIAMSAAACGDDDSRSIEVASFDFHECKRAPQRGELATGRETADYDGLECVAWKLSANSTAIDLINRLEGCGFDGNDPAPDESLWKPELERTASNALSVRVWWDFEAPSACGACFSDFSIRAKGSSVSDANLKLTLATRSCNHADCGWTEKLLTVKGAEGIRCGYVDWTKPSFTQQTYRGKLGGPTDEGACDEPLVATDVEGTVRCLKSCASNDDCEAELMHCVDGACQLTDPW